MSSYFGCGAWEWLVWHRMKQMFDIPLLASARDSYPAPHCPFHPLKNSSPKRPIKPSLAQHHTPAHVHSLKQHVTSPLLSHKPSFLSMLIGTAKIWVTQVHLSNNCTRRQFLRIPCSKHHCTGPGCYRCSLENSCSEPESTCLHTPATSANVQWIAEPLLNPAFCSSYTIRQSFNTVMQISCSPAASMMSFCPNDSSYALAQHLFLPCHVLRIYPEIWQGLLPFNMETEGKDNFLLELGQINLDSICLANCWGLELTWGWPGVWTQAACSHLLLLYVANKSHQISLSMVDPACSPVTWTLVPSPMSPDKWHHTRRCLAGNKTANEHWA